MILIGSNPFPAAMYFLCTGSQSMIKMFFRPTKTHFSKKKSKTLSSCML